MKITTIQRIILERIQQVREPRWSDIIYNPQGVSYKKSINALLRLQSNKLVTYSYPTLNMGRIYELTELGKSLLKQ
jgi:hypothetical protein